MWQLLSSSGLMWLVAAVVLSSQLCGTVGQDGSNNVLLLQLDTPSQNVSSVPPYTAYFNGTVTAPANNTDVLYGFVGLFSGANIVIIPNTQASYLKDLPPLSPGESYSGLLLTVVFPPYLVNLFSTNVWSDDLQLVWGTVDDIRQHTGSVKVQWQLMVVPSTPLLQDTLLLQFDDIDRFVTSQAPYLEYYNGTISAPATNSDTLYLFGSFVGPYPQSPSLVTTFAAIPPLSPGESYSGLLLTLQYPNTYGFFQSSYVVLFGTANDASTPNGSVSAFFNLVVNPATAVLGDPMFVGLRGQRYQVHGLDGAVYNLISDQLVQVNSRFTYLESGECLRDALTNAPLFTCWTHRGSYLSALAVRTSGGGSVVLSSGAARDGFASVSVSVNADNSGWLLSIGESATLPVVDGSSVYECTVTFTDLRTVHIARAGLYSLTVENSDHFLNILQLRVHDMDRLTQHVQSHGLLGQSWNEHTKGLDVPAVAGYVDDYVEASGDLLGCHFVNNKFDDCD